MLAAGMSLQVPLSVALAGSQLVSCQLMHILHATVVSSSVLVELSPAQVH
jgi:hypothetical protein